MLATSPLRSWVTAVLLGLALTISQPAGIATASEPKGVVFYQSDFGLKDGAVATMRGVTFSVNPTLKLKNVTREFPLFNIWEGAYRLNTTAAFWPGRDGLDLVPTVAGAACT